MEIIELWELYSEQLRGYLCKNTRHKETAEDIASQVFIKAIINQDLLAALPSNQCRAWLYTTAKRILIDLYRRKRLESRILPEPKVTQDDLSFVGVSQVIGKLPEDLQDLVAMRYYADMNSTAIGAALGLPPATVRTRLRKARTLLKKYWDQN